MILSNHGYEGYDYAVLNTLLRKVRRIEKQKGHENAITVLNLLRALENEQKTFTGYYYNTLDLYARAGMPMKLRRRMHYYRNIIKQAVGRVAQLKTDLGLPNNIST